MVLKRGGRSRDSPSESSSTPGRQVNNLLNTLRCGLIIPLNVKYLAYLIQEENNFVTNKTFCELERM